MQPTTVSKVNKEAAVQAMQEINADTPVHLVRPTKNGDEILINPTTKLPRVFHSPKAARRWAKRTVKSPAARRELMLVVAKV